MVMNPPERLSMGALLGDRIPFRVPRYQRGYAWQSEEIEDFIGDVTAIVEDGAAHHFFGGILSVRRPAPETRMGHVFELVDGQQRAATSTLLIHAVLSGYAAVAAEATASGDDTTALLATRDRDLRSGELLTYREVEPPPGTGTFSMNRLRLSRKDEEFFRQLLGDEFPRVARTSPYSHRLLFRALEDMRTALVNPVISNEELTPAEKLHRLQDVLSALTDRCYVIHITTDDPDEAYSLFTVLNDRGRSLTDGDLLRTRTLELLEGHAEHQNEVESSWNEILRGTPTEVRNFLRSYYASHQGHRWPSTGLHKAMWTTFFDQEAPVDNERARTLARQVRTMSDEHAVWRKIQAGVWPYEDSAVAAWYQQRLWRLIKVLRGAASTPLLLSVALTKDEEFFCAVVSFLERFTFRYNIVGGHASQLGDRYYDESRRLRDAPDEYGMEQLKEALGAQLARYGSEELFRGGLLERMHYTRSPVALIKHFLTTLDDYGPWLRDGAAGEPEPQTIAAYDLNGIQVEHVYPQRPRAPVEQLQPVVHEIGNLTFWAPEDNKAASNAPFREKRPLYLQSRVHMTQAPGVYEDWSAETVRMRSEELVASALSVFAIEIPDLPPGETPDREATAWLVQQNPDSRYRDREGEVYDYPYAIPNAQQIVPGDILVCYRAQRVATGERRIFGIGRIGTVIPDGDRLLAVYERYSAIDPPLSFEDLGGDPRVNRRNSINRLGAEHVQLLLGAAGIPTLEAAPEVAPDIDNLVQLGVEDQGETGVDLEE